MVNRKRRKQAAVAAVMCAYGYQLVESVERRQGKAVCEDARGGGSIKGAWTGIMGWKTFGRAETLGQSDYSATPVQEVARQIASLMPCGREIFVKRFKVRVDNQMFYVEVEEIPGEGAVAAAPVAAPAAPPRVAAPAAPKAAPQAAPKPAPAPAGGGGEGLKAPMPGTILGVKCEVGQQVKVGDVLIILEAMKMENELQADRDGVVQDIRVQKGQAVNAGEVLVVIG